MPLVLLKKFLDPYIMVVPYNSEVTYNSQFSYPVLEISNYQLIINT
jgi:hypothetical protein